MGLEELNAIKQKQQQLTKDEFEKELVKKSVSLVTEQTNEAHAQVNDVKTAQMMLNDVRTRMYPAAATGAAEGEPVVLEAQKKKSYKERREEKKRIKEEQIKIQEVRDITGLNDADMKSYKLGHEITQYGIELDNSIELLHNNPELEAQSKKNKADVRAIRSWLQGYKTDKKGKPLNKIEEEKKQKDLEFISDMVSDSLEKRRKHLDHITDTLLNLKISEDMFTPEYIAKHPKEMKNITARMTYFENIWNDPINADYFKNMEPVRKELLKTRILDNYAVVSNNVTAQCTLMGVDINNEKFYTKDLLIEVYDNIAYAGEMAKGVLKEELAETRAKEAQIFEKYQGQVLAASARKALPEKIKEGKLNPDARDSFMEGFNKGVLEKANKKFLEGKAQAIAEAKAEVEAKVKEEAKKNIHRTDLEIKKEIIDLYNKKMLLVDSYAKQEIGIRTDSNETAKLYKAYGGDIIKSMGDDMMAVSERMIASDIDMSMFKPQIQKISLAPMGSPGSVMAGGGVNIIADSLLKLVESHFKSEDCIKFFADAYVAFGSAEVFDGKLENCVQFFAQSILTNVTTGLPAKLKVKYMKTDKKDFADSICDAGTTLLGTAGLLMNMNHPFVLDTLEKNEDLKYVFGDYKAIIDKVTELVREKLGPAAPQDGAAPAAN